MYGTGYAWQSALWDAIQEHDPDEMGTKIRQAEAAIIARIMAVSYSLDYVEEAAISQALARIRNLKSEARHALK
jgi:hypothetical protein